MFNPVITNLSLQNPCKDASANTNSILATAANMKLKQQQRPLLPSTKSACDLLKKLERSRPTKPHTITTFPERWLRTCVLVKVLVIQKLLETKLRSLDHQEPSQPEHHTFFKPTYRVARYRHEILHRVPVQPDSFVHARS